MKSSNAFVAIAILVAVTGCQAGAAPSQPASTPAGTPSAPPPTPTFAPDPTATADPFAELPSAGRIVAELDHGGSTQWLHVDDEVIWLPQPGAGTVTRIDPATTELVATIDVGEVDDPNALTVGPDGRVWVARDVSQGVAEIDPETNEVTDTIDTPDFNPYALAVDGERLWMSDFRNSQVGYLDLATRELTLVELPGVTGPTGIAIAGGIVWVVLNETSQLLRIDAESAELLDRTLVGDRGLHVAAAFDTVWTNAIRSGEIVRVDLDGNVTARIRQPGHWSYGLAAGPDSVWATSGPAEGCEKEPEGSFLTRVDPQTDTVTHALPVLCAFAVAATSDAVWVIADRKLVKVEPTP